LVFEFLSSKICVAEPVVEIVAARLGELGVRRLSFFSNKTEAFSMIFRFDSQLHTTYAIVMRVSLLCVCLVATALPASKPVLWQSKQIAISGTWTGTSTCVGNRPACKNETVVYRFVPVDSHPEQVRLLADKIIDGKRFPMYALVFEYEEQTGKLTSEFTRGNTHGIWSYSIAGESMTGALVVLPERSVARDVKARRVKDAEVPVAPAIHEYDG
jgi:hypothetical protein